MDAPTETARSSETSLSKAWIDFARYHVGRYLGGRRGLLILAVAVLGIGVALNWSWLVVVGVAPVLVALAPCAVMCALGLCMSRMGGKSCSTQSTSADEKPDVRMSSATAGDPQRTEPTVAGSALVEASVTPDRELPYPPRASVERKEE